jgi:hypothetical protein
MSGTDTGKLERAPYAPPTFRRLDVEESKSTPGARGSFEIHIASSTFFGFVAS